MRHVVICPVQRCPYTGGYAVEVDYRNEYSEPGRVMRFRSWKAMANYIFMPYYATVRVLWSVKKDGTPIEPTSHDDDNY